VLLAVAVVVAVLLVDREAMDALYPLGAERQAASGAEPAGAGRMAQVLVGEGFYVVAASLGLAVAGAAALARSRPAWPFLAAAALMALVAAVQIGTAWHTGSFQPRYATYGRYIDPFVPVLVAIGVAVPLRRRIWLPLAMLAALAVVVALTAPDTGSSYQPAVLGGLLGLNAPFESATSPALSVAGIAALAAVGVLALVLAGDRHRAPVAVALLALLSLVGAATKLEPYHAASDAAYDDLQDALRLRPGAPVTVVLPSRKSRERSVTEATLHRLQVLEPGRRVRITLRVALRASSRAPARLPLA
jgi:hypothetical protein